MSRLREVVSPPDRIEADLAVVFFEPAAVAPDGPAGLFDCRLGGALTEHLASAAAGRPAGQQLLVRATGRIASSWVLFFPLAKADREQPRRGLAAVDTAREAGFSCLLIAPPVEWRLCRESWLAALQEVVDQPVNEGLECLVTFDRSYLHDHAAAVFNFEKGTYAS